MAKLCEVRKMPYRHETEEQRQSRQILKRVRIESDPDTSMLDRLRASGARMPEPEIDKQDPIERAGRNVAQWVLVVFWFTLAAVFIYYSVKAPS
jgi:hypothetical protein